MVIKKYCHILLFFLVVAVVPAVARAKGEEGVDVRIIPEVTKSGFVGETYVYEVALLSSSPDIANVRVIRSQKFPPGIKLIKGATNNSRPVRTEIKGKTYYKWTIMRNFLVPDTEGKFRIGDAEFMVFIPHEKVVYRDFWGDRRMVEYEEVKLDCKSLDFKVNALPYNKTGFDFAGCTGDFKIEGWFPPGNIQAGKEAYAVFSISGFGSLETLQLPNLFKCFGKGCQLREVEQNEEQMQRDGKLFSEVTLTCRFLPEDDEFEINPLTLLFFNPETKRYYEAESDALHWTSSPQEKKNKKYNEAVEI